jgi:hypothetical protein
MKARLLTTIAVLLISGACASAQESQESIESVPSDMIAKPADLPVNAPSGAVVKSLGGFYLWGQGGAWNAMQQKPADPNAPDRQQNSQAATPDMPLPTASSATTRGAVGYVMPSGTFSPQLGSNVRAEFGLSQTTASLPLSGGAGSTVYNGITLGGCATCGGIAGYDSTEMNAKAASDYKFDALTLTPSVTIFNSQSQQSFSGSSDAALGWRDTGAKVGLDGKVDVNREVSLGLGGSYGRAARSVTFSAADSHDGETSPYLASGEAKITYKPAEELTLNGYAGVSNYDNRLPGISSGGKLDYSSASNTYYGAGATWRFGTK